MKCKKCRAEFSASTARCPECGLNVADRITPAGIAIGGLLLAVPILFTTHMLTLVSAQVRPEYASGEIQVHATTPEADAADELVDATLACQDFTRKTLPHPEVARFEGYRSGAAKRLRPDNFRVYLDAVIIDPFGSRRQINVDCRINRRDGRWISRSIKELS